MLRLYYPFFFVFCIVHMGICQLSPETIQLQSSQTTTLLNNMNFSVKPCDDFYEYACGNWNKLNSIPEHKEFWSTLLSTGKKEEEEIQRVVESPSDKQEFGHAITKARDFYASCINSTRKEERGVASLLAFLKTLGGFPAINDKWTEDGKDWLNLLAETRRLDQRLIFDSFVFNDIFNRSRNSLYIQFSYMGLSSRHSFLNGGKELNAYKTLINNVLNALKTSNHSKAVEEIVDFETELAKIILDHNELGDLLTTGQNITTLGAVQGNFTNIDWLRYFTLVHNQTFDPSERVLVMTWDYLKKLDNLIKRTPIRTRFNYLMWKLVYLLIESIGDEFENILLIFKTEVNGVQNRTPLRQKCVQNTILHFAHAVGSTYVKTFLNETTRADAEHLLSLLKESLRELIENAHWVDQISRDAAVLKLNKMAIEIGYPHFLLDPIQVDNFYKTVDINKTTYEYLENFLNIQRLQNHLQTVLIGKKVDNRSFPTSFLEMNAYYTYPKQTIFANAPMFKPPFYHKDSPKFMNFGGIATVIAHEISHGFDLIGMRFDSERMINNWFGNASMEIYKQRATCFVQKYGNYSLNGTHLNGEKLVREVIGDDAGIKTSFLAYQRWLQANNDEIVLQDERVSKYDLTPKKMFFINSAQLHCTEIRPEAWPQLLKKEPHALRQFRVNGIMSNSKYFSDVFQCPIGSAMNPSEKCAIW